MKETFYFSHDYNARSDWKLVKVMMKHWVAWIWSYWCIIEMLYEEQWYLSIKEYDRISFELRVSYEMIQSVINDYWLFNKDDNNFWSNSVLDRLKQRIDKSEKARISVQKRWDKKKEENTTVLQTNYDSNTIKERKGKETKENKSKTETDISKDIWSTDLVIEEPKEYWNTEINQILLLLKQTVWCDDFKESQQWQRKYWKHFLNLWVKIWKEEFWKRLQWILSDKFKSKNCNSLKYLYDQMKSYIHSPIISNIPKVW